MVVAWRHPLNRESPVDQVSAGALLFVLMEVLMEFPGRYIIKTWSMACEKNLTTKRTSLR